MDAFDREAALLTSPEAAGLLQAALTGDGPPPVDFTSELIDWHYRPGAEVTAGYRVQYRDPSGATVAEYLYATTAAVDAPAASLSQEGLRFGVWRHPQDPRLPGLAPACDPATVLAWLAEAGQPTPATFDLTLLGYRPLRRAVLRATADGSASYLKVLRPDRADRLVRRQELLATAGLTPAVAARPAPGAVLTPSAPGRPLAELLAAADPGLPSASALIELLDRLPPALAGLDHRPAWSERLDFHAATATRRLGDARPIGLAARLHAALDRAPAGPPAPTHGDFYEANIFVDDARLYLIDLDLAGPGRRVDDLACLLAHLAVLPTLSPQHYQAVPGVLAAWTADFAAAVHPDALAARVSAVLLSLVAGGDPDQAERRLQLAEDWAGRLG